MRGLVIYAVALIATPAYASRISALTVGHHGDRYSIDMQARLDIPPTRAFAMLTDYAMLPRINASVQQAKVLGEDAGGAVRLFTRTRVCAALFCETLKQVQDMYAHAAGDGGSLDADVIGQLSDFSYGRAHWALTSCADSSRQTCLHFSAVLVPKFWVPPLIGNWLIERGLRHQALRTCDGVEHLARAGSH